jgi:hypothetical protein
MTTISYDKPVEDFIARLDDTKHVTHTSYKKTSVTLHHNGGKLSHQGILDVWKTRAASAHFDVDSAGAVAQYVRVGEYAWAVGSTIGNESSISIEMCNATLAPSWTVSDVTWKSAARLAAWLFAHVVGARPSATNLHYHHFWSSTDCAGPYMDTIYTKVLTEAQHQYDIFTGAATPTVIGSDMDLYQVPDGRFYLVGSGRNGVKFARIDAIGQNLADAGKPVYKVAASVLTALTNTPYFSADNVSDIVDAVVAALPATSGGASLSVADVRGAVADALTHSSFTVS